ncbi:hypothetical protein WJX82_010864 [Trebouxia sp. C0006]
MANRLSASWQCRSQHRPLIALRHVVRTGLTPKHQRQNLQIACTARPRRKDVQLATRKAQEDDPTPFFEPLLRSFVLGLGTGALFEASHVSWKFISLLSELGTHRVTDLVSQNVDRFAPLLVGDHMVAVASMILFYIIEAVAIYTVLKQHPHDADAAESAARNTMTIPKKMLPLRLALFKQMLLWNKTLTPASASSTASAFTGSPAASPKPWGPSFSIPSRAGSSTATADVELPMSTPAAPATPTGEASDIAIKVQSNIVLAPQRVDSPVTKPNKPDGGVPLAQPVDVKALEQQRRQKGLKPGEWDPNTSLLAHRMKELQGRRAYLKNFWYAAAVSEKVKEGKAHGVEMCGEKLVLFRGKDGKVHCLNDVCPHRGAPLSQGWVSEVQGHDCVVCPYHGWAFDEEGVLRDVPAAEKAEAWPRKQLVDSYAVQEKGGFVWLFYGSKTFPADERPPIPYVPELDDPTWKPVYGEIEFACNHWSVFENAIDMAHIHYLHSDSFGNQDSPQIRDMTCTHNAYGVKAGFGLHNKPVNKFWEFSQVPIVHVTAQALLPSTSVISFTLGNGLSFTTFVNTVPISGNRTVNRFALVRNLAIDKTGIFNMGAWDRFARQAMVKILTEDKAMVEQLRPEMLPREISVKADLPQIAFRKLRQEYIDMGYGVSPEATENRYRAPDQ